MTRKYRSSRPMTADRLERAACHYLERYTASTNGFRRILERKIRRSNDDFSEITAEQQAWIDALVEKFIRLRLLDDRLYAMTKARSLMQRGKPVRAIRQWLTSRGVELSDIDHAVAMLAEEQGGRQILDMAAACRFAKRRRFGPWHRENERERDDRKRRNREIAAFSRAGFSWQQTMAILDAQSIEDALALTENNDMRNIDNDWSDI